MFAELFPKFSRRNFRFFFTEKRNVGVAALAISCTVTRDEKEGVDGFELSGVRSDACIEKWGMIQLVCRVSLIDNCGENLRDDELLGKIFDFLFSLRFLIL